MLRGLEIRDMLIIDRLELSFQPGLNVLTGETGAGKSILLDALGFVLGWRGRADLVREGAAQGEVTAWFDLPDGHAAEAILQDAGITADGELILRRVNAPDGRKTAWVNDRRASGEVLRRLSETLIELHGQHDDRGLLNARGHQHLLDQYGGLEADVSHLRKLWRDVANAREQLAARQAAIAEIEAEEDFLRHAVSELKSLEPAPGEAAALDARRRMMQAAERVGSDIQKAAEALGLQGAEGQLTDASRWLSGATEHMEDALASPLAAIEQALEALDTAQGGVAQCLDQLSFNPHELEEAEERLFAIRALARKHNVHPDELPQLGKELVQRLELLDGGKSDLDVLQNAVDQALAIYDTAATDLRNRRVEAGKKLDRAMAVELAPLKMERAVFATELSEAPDGPEGRDAVAFQVATNPGAPPGPLNKIASGGELSRFLLALKVCLTQVASGSLTMIFDEIDRGVGGATADAVGRRLSELSNDGQVLVVTHSPQVAALADHHWRVEKQQTASETRSLVVELGVADRVEEVARMLSGDTITEAAKAAAVALLEGKKVEGA